MRNPIAIFAFVALALLSASCTKTIEFDGETKTPKLVVNSLFNTEDTFKVHLSYSLALVDDGDLGIINDAIVKVYDDAGNLVATPLHNKKGTFMAPEFSPMAKSNYKITVESNGYESVEASDLVPNAVPITSLDTQRVRAAGGYDEMRVRFKFTDPQGEDNYYLVEATSTYRFKFDTVFNEYTDKMWINSSDPNVNGNSGIDAVYGQRLIFTDRRIDGKNYEFTVNMDAWPFSQEESSNVQLRLYSLSRAAYNYFVSLDQYDRTRDNPFATPVQVFSNVEKGFGIFGGAAIHVEQLKE